MVAFPKRIGRYSILTSKSSRFTNGGDFKLSLKRKLIKSFVGVGAMKLMSMPVALATSIILARTLGAEKFGQYTFIMALIPLIALPVSGGLRQLLTREVATFVYSGSWGLYRGALRAAHIWVLLNAAIVILGYTLLRIGFDLIPLNEKWNLLPVALLLVPLNGLAAVRIGAVKGLGFPAYAEMPEQIIKPILLLILFCILTWQGFLHLETAIWCQVAAAAFAFFVASLMFSNIQPHEARGVTPRYRLRHWKSALFPFSMIALVSTLNSQVAIVALGVLGTDEQVAAMRIAERGGQLVGMSLMLANMVIAPYIVRAHRDGDKRLLEKLARQSARGCFLLALPVAALLVVSGQRLIEIAFGAEYSDTVYVPLVVIVLGQLINVFFGSVANLLSMSGYERDTLKGHAWAVLINFILCLALIPHLGVLGAAIGVAVGVVLYNIFLCYIVKLRVGIKSSVF